ncbi:mediator of RNA polymerase II transcription subunit 12-like protein isoform X5 [Mytilus trossulus]|uniref:mediator of RNA polymerase II transcription subunit 12-like protein isoform X5 n=1 Tax=Mytilus trossulus TaxID=6551 RepID=UPI0030043587
MQMQMSAYPSQEFRPLKKPRLGPPDVYPQEPKQKEDELTEKSVKHGFNNTQMYNMDEYGSARRENISEEKFGSEFIALLNKKKEYNTFQDTSKKKQQPSKDNFWPAAKNKSAMEAWFKDLAGNKPLHQLGKKVPTFNKKEEIFSTLCEYNIPNYKCAWFIKMTGAYNVAMQENKTKKRQAVDQSVEWSHSMMKYLNDQLQKINEPHHSAPGGPTSGFLTVQSVQPAYKVDQDLAQKQWQFGCKLARHLCDEGLLDRHEFLTWIIDSLEKLKQPDDTVIKMILTQVLEYLDEITMSVLLSRKLAHYSCKKIATLCSESELSVPRTDSPMLAANGQGMTSANNGQILPPQPNPLNAVFQQYINCPQHRGIILSLSAIAQYITLLCPTALVWNNLGEGRSTHIMCASPLDLLPCPPSALPMPDNPQRSQIRAQLRTAENQIRVRGRGAEMKWSSDKCQQSTRGCVYICGHTIAKVLDVLDTLDRHNFHKVQTDSSLDTLYDQIFTANLHKDGNETFGSLEPIINLLIDWAVSTQRSGNYRAVVVAKLMEKLQNELRSEKYGESDMLTDKDSVASDTLVPMETPVFQNILFQFLDERASCLDENPNEENKQGFANLIMLFCELIRHDVFSHDSYMCTLISRGDLSSSPDLMSSMAESIDISSVKSQNESIRNEPQEDIKIDFDIHMDSDFGSLFGPVVKEEQKTSPEQPASVKSVKSEKEQVTVQNHESVQTPKGPSRHMLYAQHFPIPQDEMSSHECNQRMTVLYGVGKARDEARHIVKKVTKETLRLFSKKNCIDVSSGDLGKNKKKKDKEIGEASSVQSATNFESIFEGIFNKFQKLSYYDQHVVTHSCVTAVLEQINGFVNENSDYLPLVENISFLIDLMEYSCNIYGLLEFSVQLLKDLSSADDKLVELKSALRGSYTTSLCLCIVGVFRKYHAYLLVSNDLTIQAFEGLIGVVKNVYNPADCSSSERCILAYLYDAYSSCCYLVEKFSEMFLNAHRKMKMTLYATTTPLASNSLWDPSFMIDFINNTKAHHQHESSVIKHLTDTPANRYSFVCNAVIHVCNSPSIERLNEISILCAELTARYNALSSDWLGVLQSLCCSSNHSCGFIDVLAQCEVSDMSIHNNLAVFTTILVARHCFSLQDLVIHVILPSLLAVKTASGDQDAEPGARLTCQILLRLFKTSDMNTFSWCGSYGKANVCNIKSSCDKHLLIAAHDSISVGPVLAVLKAMLVLSDLCSDENRSKSGGKKDSMNERDIISSLLNSIGDDDDVDMMLGTSKWKGKESSLSDFARHAMKEMCRQEWVQEKFLKDPDAVLSSDLLLDQMLSNKQAQQILHMICYPNGVPNQVDGADMETKQNIHRVLQNLNLWDFRVCALELQLMFKQCSAISLDPPSSQSDKSLVKKSSSVTAETNYILDQVARGTIELLHQQTETNKPSTYSMIMEPEQQNRVKMDKDSVWMFGPLIAKLPSQVQGRILKLAAQVLETGNNVINKGKFDKERNLKSKSLLGHQPFLSLVLTCLKGQDEQREGLLCSLLHQQFINNCKDALDKTPDEFKERQNIHEALQLRLSLVGGMFDTIQRNNSNTTDWTFLLLQLVTSGIVDSQSNSELFTNILDMLCVLIHGTLVNDGMEKGEENTKAYTTLIKKLRKEFSDKLQSESLDKIRQLLPLPKRYYEVIVCEPHGTQVDSKGNKFDGFSKKQGFQVSKKERISPWEVIEGFKYPPPLSWTFFGAVRLEKKPLKYEEQHRVQLYHTHALRKNLSYFLEPPNLPPEDLEPPQEKVEEKPKEPAETAVAEKKRVKKKNKRTNSGSGSGGSFIQTPMGGYGSRMDYNNPGPPPSWGSMQQPTPPNYYSPMQQGPGPRFPPGQYSSKQAIQSMLRGRGSNYPIGGTSQPSLKQIQMIQQQQQSQMVRAQIRNQVNRMSDMTPYARQIPGQGMHINQQPGITQPYNPPYSMPPQPATTGDITGNQIMPQGFNQSYQSSQNPSMLQPMGNQQGYMSQQPHQQQFNTSRIQPGMQNPNTGMSNIPNYNQMGMTPSQGQGTFMQQRMVRTQQQQQAQQRQQMLQQQLRLQQQQMPQQSTQPQHNANLMAQLQQQMGVRQQPSNAYNPQYQQPPQYQ